MKTYEALRTELARFYTSHLETIWQRLKDCDHNTTHLLKRGNRIRTPYIYLIAIRGEQSSITIEVIEQNRPE